MTPWKESKRAVQNNIRTIILMGIQSQEIKEKKKDTVTPEDVLTQPMPTKLIKIY